MPFVDTCWWYTSWFVILLVPVSIFLLFLSSSSLSGRGFDADVDLTVRRGLGFSVARRTPEIHPRVLDAGRPGEIDGVLVIEGQVGPRIEPVHISATIRRKKIQEKQEDGAIIVVLKLRGRHVAESEGGRFLDNNHSLQILQMKEARKASCLRRKELRIERKTVDAEAGILRASFSNER